MTFFRVKFIFKKSFHVLLGLAKWKIDTVVFNEFLHNVRKQSVISLVRSNFGNKTAALLIKMSCSFIKKCFLLETAYHLLKSRD